MFFRIRCFFPFPSFRVVILLGVLFGGMFFPPRGLPEAASEMLPQVLVTASPLEEEVLELPGSLEVLYPEKSAGEGKSLGDLLEEAVGVQVVRSYGRGGYTVASVRGSTSSQVIVYLDGLRMNLESDAAFNLQDIEADDVARIEIYRGHVPAMFGISGMGAVINVLTKAPTNKPQGSAGLRLGSLGEQAFSGSWSAPLGEGRFRGSLSLEGYGGDFSYWNDNNTAYNPRDDYQATRQHNGYSTENLFLRWEDDLWKVFFRAQARDQDLPLPAPGNDKGPWDALGNPLAARVESSRMDLGVETERLWGEVLATWRMEYLSQVREFFDPWDQMGMYNQRYNRYDTERTALSGAFKALVGERHALEFRMDWSSENLDMKGDGIATLSDSRGSYSRSRSNYVLQDSIFLLPDQSLVVEPLLRWNQVDGEGHLSWSLGASWNFRENWYLKGSGGYSHRAPNLYEMYGDGSMIVPNADLAWEEGFQWDLGLYWAREGEGWSSRVGLTSFVLDTDNLIEFVMINPRYGVYQNMGKAFISGMELESAFSWDDWSLALSYTWMEGENRSPGYRYGQPLPNRPEHALYGRLSRALSPELLAFGEVIHTGENYFDDAGSILYGDCTQWNLGLKWQFRKEATLGLGVRDLLDATSEITFQPIGYGPERLAWYPLPGRTWYLSLSWRF